MKSTTNTPLRETDIRPDHLLKEQAKHFKSDIERLIQRKHKFLNVCCPACDANDAREVFKKYEMTYVKCQACETVYINPRPSPELLETYYATSENYAYWNKYIFPASEETRRERIFRPRAHRLAEICRRYVIKRELFLEVGAGFGTFCEEVRDLELFKNIIAIEPTPDLSETCRQKGIEVIAAPVEQVTLKHTVDVIASFEVIEHLFSPKQFLQSCTSLLSPGGLIVLTCPNIKGFDISVLQSISDAVDPEHLNYFHPSSLKHLLETCHFDLLEVSTPGKLDAELVRKKALKGEFDLSNQPFLEQILLTQWEHVGAAFQTFLADHHLSSHMWVVARKKE